MQIRRLDPKKLSHDEDWEGNIAAFKCPLCGKVFIVSGSSAHGGVRKCPECARSIGRCDMLGKNSGGIASIEW